MKKILPWAAFILMLTLGAGLLAYPSISDYVNRINGSHAIQMLDNTLEETGEAELRRQQELAEAYNRWLLHPEEECPEAYEEILSFGNGVMGALEIPDISVSLPIYHGIGEETLSRGLGHMPQSAFPVGGEGNHAAIVGHTGLPSAKMLDDLIRLEEGDCFFLSVLGETLQYRVDQILVVEPWDTGPLAPVPGEDHCTIVTCTPYGVNSHRLLVRGERIPTVAQTMAVQEQAKIPLDGIWWLSVCCALLLGIAAAAALLVRLVRK